MTLWMVWMEAVRALRPACSRTRTFLWMVLTLISLCCRADLAGVTSYVRVLGLMTGPTTASSICSTARGLIWISSPLFGCVSVPSFSSPSALVIAWSVLPTASRHPKSARRCPRSRGCTNSRPATPSPNTSWVIRFRPSRCWPREGTEMSPLSPWLRAFTKGCLQQPRYQNTAR
jgi:hypothetical protein